MASIEKYKPLLLLSSSNPKFILQVFIRTFQLREDGINQTFLESVASQLKINNEQSKSLLESILFISKLAVYYDFDQKERVMKLFPPKFPNETKELLSEEIRKCVPLWRDISINTQVSIPKLVDLKWRCDITTSSHSQWSVFEIFKS